VRLTSIPEGARFFPFVAALSLLARLGGWWLRGCACRGDQSNPENLPTRGIDLHQFGPMMMNSKVFMKLQRFPSIFEDYIII
jgi:hypothetical protein